MEGENGQGVGKDDENVQQILPAALFPLQVTQSSVTAPDPQWLHNISFTSNISRLPITETSYQYSPVAVADQDEVFHSPRPHDYELLSSSGSERDNRERAKRRKKRRKKNASSEVVAGIPRKSDVDVWADSDAKKAKDYYFDSKGDRDNLAFGSLYRMDVARYRLCNPPNTSELCFQHVYQRSRGNLAMNLDVDADYLDRNFRESGRYYSAKYVTLEHHKKFKHLLVIATGRSAAFPGDFIPFIEVEDLHDHAGCGLRGKVEVDESWEEVVLHRAKDFTKMSREFPHDEKVWLAFAEFQDCIAAKQPQKAARMQTMEKKISILERAVENNPDNENLLLSLLKAYQGRDSTDILMERWEKVLSQHSGSWKLWNEFLHVCQGDFTKFKVSDMRKVYAYAIQALSASCVKSRRQMGQAPNTAKADPALVHNELGLVHIFVNLCRFEWQTGYKELATGLFQAEIEYSLFCPSLLLAESSKRRLFEYFWNSNGARLGEEGAQGWSMWLEKEEKYRQKSSVDDSFQEEKDGGWTGWLDPPSRKDIVNKETEIMDDDGGDEETAAATENMKQEEDVESLLQKLGMNVDLEVDSHIKDSSVWKKWSEEELSRDCKQWLPMRESSGASGSDIPPKEGEEFLSRVILFDDINEYLFSLSSEEAKILLLLQFIDFFGGNISVGICTNSPSWTLGSLWWDTLPDSLVEKLTKAHEVDAWAKSISNVNLRSLLKCLDDDAAWATTMKFLRNAILLCLNIFPRNYIVEEALLASESLLPAQMNFSDIPIPPFRPLAKSLLKSDRQDLLLCGVYAKREAAYGNVDLARRVFDMALMSVGGLSLDLQICAPLLYFWYSEMELAACESGNGEASCQARALHILSCLGCGSGYTPFSSEPSSLQLLRAHQGFKDQIRCVFSTWAHGDIKDHSVALLCAASQFEVLTSRGDAGLAIFEEAFLKVLPERRRLSPQLESLFNYYICMLQRRLRHLKSSKVLDIMLCGLQIYPQSPCTLAGLVEVICLYATPNKMRHIFDEHFKRNPSLIVCLFALSFELEKPGSEHRIHRLFERALANETLQKSVLLWRCYLAYEIHMGDHSAAKRVFFRAVHACPWSKILWLDGFKSLYTDLSAKELSDLQEVMRDKELHLRTDIYEILLQEEMEL